MAKKKRERNDFAGYDEIDPEFLKALEHAIRKAVERGIHPAPKKQIPPGIKKESAPKKNKP